MQTQIVIEKPVLNRGTPEENIALIDKWISDTADKLNFYIKQQNRERSNDNGKRTED